MGGNAPLDITRHCEELSESETDEVVGIVADLIVAYLKKRAGPAGRHRSASAPADRQEVEA